MTEPRTRESDTAATEPDRTGPGAPGRSTDPAPVSTRPPRGGSANPPVSEVESGSSGEEDVPVRRTASGHEATVQRAAVRKNARKAGRRGTAELGGRDVAAGTPAGTGQATTGAGADESGGATSTGPNTASAPVVEPGDSGADPPRTAVPEARDGEAAPAPERPRTLVLRVPRLRRPSVPALVIVLAVAAAAIFAVLWRSDGTELTGLHADLAADRRAEAVAGDYALRVSRVEHTDLESWRRALQNGVSAELAPKLSAAVDVVGPWLTQLEYRATGTLLAAKVTAREGDTFTVAAFVEMRSTSRQAPTGVTATAAYTVTLDRAAEWIITDVGGSGLAPAGAAAPGGVPEAMPDPQPPR